MLRQRRKKKINLDYMIYARLLAKLVSPVDSTVLLYVYHLNKDDFVFFK